MTHTDGEGHPGTHNAREKALALPARVVRLRGGALFLVILTVGSVISIGADLLSGRYSWSMLASLAVGVTVWVLAWPSVVQAWRRTDRQSDSGLQE
ncbi:hypothetical protein [Nocardia sp. NPDC020380]|uniref:hypothetical protein n=1 Tax=Nocardia sp. NPDC020380 TaxID=3364309 RepID=UPI00378868E2